MSKNSLLESFSGFAEQMHFFTLSAIKQSVLDIENIKSNKITADNIIQGALDRMLDHAFDDAMLILYKQLCRYYWDFNPKATSYYIKSYREMWDENYPEEDTEE